MIADEAGRTADLGARLERKIKQGRLRHGPADRTRGEEEQEGQEDQEEQQGIIGGKPVQARRGERVEEMARMD